jgi:hypothetical protein
MDVEQYISVFRDGLRSGWKNAICGTEFAWATATDEPSKGERDAQHQLCREHVIALCTAQDGGTMRPGRTLAERQQQYRANQ